MTAPHRPGGQNEAVPTDSSRSPDVNKERRYSAEETGRLGDEIYERDIKPTLAEDQHGRVLAIDVESGDWAIADEVLDAAADLRTRRPDASDVWLMRVGYRGLHHFSGDALGRRGPGLTERATRAPVRSRCQDALKETARRGDEIYERDIKPTLSEDQHGRVVAIDVESGNWAIADEVLNAAARLRARHPDASDVWLLRVGHCGLYSFAGPGSPPQD